MRLWNSLVARVPKWSSRTWGNNSWQSFETSAILHSFPSCVWTSCHFVNSESYCAFFSFPSGSIEWAHRRWCILYMTVGQHFYFLRLHGDGATEKRDVNANSKWRGFVNIVPKQWTLSGFLPHTSNTTLYIWNAEQLNITYEWKCFTVWGIFQANSCTWTQLLSITSETGTVSISLHR